MKFSDFIYVVDGSLTQDFCKGLIDKFEQEPLKGPGQCGSKNGNINTKMKKSIDCYISDKINWSQEHNFLAEKVNQHTFEYDVSNPVKEIIPNPNQLRTEDEILNLDVFDEGIHNTGFQLQKTKPGEYFHWHQDFATNPRGSRMLTYMWYLNTLEDEDDGYTEFLDGTKIQPKVGRFVLFPSCWTFYHRGFPPKKDKYICTGWIYQNFPKSVIDEMKTLLLDDRLVN